MVRLSPSLGKTNWRQTFYGRDEGNWRAIRPRHPLLGGDLLMNNSNDKVLFWASFFTLIAAGMGFSIRGDILADWGQDFGFTQTDLGIITGQGLAGFGITIIF